MIRSSICDVRRLLLLAALACTVLATPCVCAATGINGAQSGTWSLADSPYLVTSDVFIPTGTTLTIEPGVVIHFEDLFDGLFVDGTLLARGTPAAPIRFTSDEAAPAPGQWEGIYFRAANASSVLEYAIVENGGAPGFSSANIVCSAGSPRIHAVTIQASGADGLSVGEASPTSTTSA